MIIDCDRCVVRGAACAGCVVSVLLGGPPDSVDLDGSGGGVDGLVEVDLLERAALDALASGGLIPPLRLVLPDSATG